MRYHVLELGITEAEQGATPNEYTAESTILTPGCTRVLIMSEGENPFVVQFGQFQQGLAAKVGSIVWQHPETFLGGVSAALSRNFDALRVKNRYSGKEAKVVINVA